MTLAVPMPLTQFRHDPARILIKPFTGPNSIQRKRSKHRRVFFGGLAPHSREEIRAKPLNHTIKPLTQVELGVETAAIELVDQPFKAVLAQHAPTRLRGQRISPALNLLGTHMGRWLLPIPSIRLVLRSLPLLPTQPIELLMQALHLPSQGIVLAQQSLHVAGDAFTLVRPVSVVSG